MITIEGNIKLDKKNQDDDIIDIYSELNHFSYEENYIEENDDSIH
jgi:hypothetical protein